MAYMVPPWSFWHSSCKSRAGFLTVRQSCDQRVADQRPPPAEYCWSKNVTVCVLGLSALVAGSEPDIRLWLGRVAVQAKAFGSCPGLPVDVPGEEHARKGTSPTRNMPEQ